MVCRTGGSNPRPPKSDAHPTELSGSAIVIWAATWQNQQNGCAPSEDSDRPGHPPSLIRIFAVPTKKAWILSYPLSAQQRLWIQTGQMPKLIWVFAGRTLILLVLSCRGSYYSAAPFWTTRPQDQETREGDSVTFNCEASGTPVPTSQWFIDGVPILGRTWIILIYANCKKLFYLSSSPIQVLNRWIQHCQTIPHWSVIQHRHRKHHTGFEI